MSGSSGNPGPLACDPEPIRYSCECVVGSDGETSHDFVEVPSVIGKREPEKQGLDKLSNDNVSEWRILDADDVTLHGNRRIETFRITCVCKHAMEGVAQVDSRKKCQIVS